jgi:glycopeptide antibiotics resistance protein
MKVWVKVIFFIYLLTLVKLILFKGALFFQIVPTSTEYIEESKSKSIDSHNLVPFRSIVRYFTGNTSIREFFFNIMGNILLFVPFGFLLPMFRRKVKQLKVVAIASGLLSLLFELYQFLTSTGQFDVDDILLNLIGGITGYLLYSFAGNFFPEALYRNQAERKEPEMTSFVYEKPSDRNSLL